MEVQSAFLTVGHSSLSNASNLSNGSNVSNVSDSIDANGSIDTSEIGQSMKQQPLDFAKRKVSDAHTQKLFSQLSSMTSRSPSRLQDPMIGRGDERVLDFEDQERITSPASTEAYFNSNNNTDMGENTSGDGSDFNPGSQGLATSPSLISPRTNLPLPDIDYQSSYKAKKRHYEPARVVLHKIELQKPRNDSIKSDHYQENVIMPNSLLSTLGSSPDNDTPLRQIRELKQPIYVPAVLRPTEANAYGVNKGKVTMHTSYAGQASTKHWAEDKSTTNCQGCHRSFAWYRRRHHCRKCGKIFCSSDVRYQVGLDRMLNFSVLGQPSKACKQCADNFKAFCTDTPVLSNAATMEPVAVVPEEVDTPEDVPKWSTF